MVFISIAEAAELTGKSIPTLYQHILEGKLSLSNDKVNATELSQLYGALRAPADYRRENEFLHNLTLHLKQDKERLYQINDLLRKSNADLKQEKDKLYRLMSQEKSPSPQPRLRKSNAELKQEKDKLYRLMSQEKTPSPQPLQIDIKIKDLDHAIKIEKYQEIDSESLIQRLFRKLLFK